MADQSTLQRHIASAEVADAKVTVDQVPKSVESDLITSHESSDDFRIKVFRIHSRAGPLSHCRKSRKGRRVSQ